MGLRSEPTLTLSGTGGQKSDPLKVSSCGTSRSLSLERFYSRIRLFLLLQLIQERL